jgi:phytoene synthase
MRHQSPLITASNALQRNAARPPVGEFEARTADDDAALVAAATQAIEVGSGSFASAARLFDEATRESTVMLYAWCRHCDDVIDGQEMGHGQREGSRENNLQKLLELEEQTRRACAGQRCDHPAFEGLAEVVRRHKLSVDLPLAHLSGFRMDVEDVRYRSMADTLLYCYRVAGVVGLMMAKVMGARDAATLDRACDLGIAFQLTNIARDVVEDAAIGRVYLPEEWLVDAGIPVDRLAEPQYREALAGVAARLVEAADPYYASSVPGIGALPLRSAWSVATARGVYRAIGRKVKQRGSHAWDVRVSTTSFDKLWFAARGVAVAVAAKSLNVGGRSDRLWQRPH